MEITFINQEGDLMNSFDDFRGLEQIEIAYSKDEDCPLDNYLTIDVFDNHISVIDSKFEVAFSIKSEYIKVDDNSLYDFFHKTTTMLNENSMGRYEYNADLKINLGDRMEMII